MRRHIRSMLSATIALVAGGALAQAGEEPDSGGIRATYVTKCAMCHGESLEGGGGPALNSAAFKTKWGGAGTEALADYIARSMPPAADPPLDLDLAKAFASYLLAEGKAGGKQASASEKPVTGFALDEFARAARDRLGAVAEGLRPVTDAMLRQGAADDWLVWRGSTDALGFSQLDQIDQSNVGRLQLVWSKSLGPGMNSIAPLEHDGVIFLHGGGQIAALDALSGDTIWRHEDKVAPRNVTQPRGVALYDDALYASTVDNRLMALDAKTGVLRWKKVIADKSALTSAPLVANGIVFQGGAVCFGKGMRCFMAAFDAKTGKELWRFDTVPGDNAPGSESWGGAPASERGGAGVWTPPSYDYAEDQLVFGTGNTYAVNTILKNDPARPEAALYTNSTLNLDAKTGKLTWHFQHFPGDVWDEDWAFERMIVRDPRGGGGPIVMSMGKLGILEAIDLKTGKYLWSYDYGLQDIITRIDAATGAKTIDSDKIPGRARATSACPYAAGFRNWPATSYDPRIGVLFLPALDACMEVTIDDSIADGSVWQPKPRPGSGNKFGLVAAIDVRTGKKLWEVNRRAPEASAVLATAGSLLFEGSRDRWFRALDSGTGKTLWQFQLTDTPNSFPITYLVNGRQYVAVVSGGGTYQDGFVSRLVPEIEPSVGGPALWVFALDSVEAKAAEQSWLVRVWAVIQKAIGGLGA
ncbi:MAG TPA: PQQ-binding-like beta-propeller repeat protein [Novosphingobium sp.]|nr:PQQ-binding-like beta-propeller repeat protein [Novosphingobium sp.]